jgi:hypothetical protein
MIWPTPRRDLRQCADATRIPTLDLRLARDTRMDAELIAFSGLIALADTIGVPRRD